MHAITSSRSFVGIPLRRRRAQSSCASTAASTRSWNGPSWSWSFSPPSVRGSSASLPLRSVIPCRRTTTGTVPAGSGAGAAGDHRSGHVLPHDTAHDCPAGSTGLVGTVSPGTLDASATPRPGPPTSRTDGLRGATTTPAGTGRPAPPRATAPGSPSAGRPRRRRRRRCPGGASPRGRDRARRSRRRGP